MHMSISKALISPALKKKNNLISLHITQTFDHRAPLFLACLIRLPGFQEARFGKQP